MAEKPKTRLQKKSLVNAGSQRSPRNLSMIRTNFRTQAVWIPATRHEQSGYNRSRQSIGLSAMTTSRKSQAHQDDHDRRILDARAAISRQCQLIASQEARGEDTASAKSLLS